MNKRPVFTIQTMNPASANVNNINRMTFLTSISEITPQLFLSGQMAATIDQVQKLGITYIVNVAIESSLIPYPKSIKLEKFDIIDFPTAPISNYFNILTDKIHGHITGNKQNKVLVHCMAGISRSTTIVCAYLMRYMNMTLRDAYLLCKKNRPICFPNLGFWNQLIAYEVQLRKETSVKMVPTQFGHIPDLAFEEIKQIRAQQAQMAQTNSMGFSVMPALNVVPSNVNSTNPSETASAASPLRSTGRDLSIGPLNGVVRSRSLASNVTRPQISSLPNGTNTSIYSNGLLTTHKPATLNNISSRYGVSRVNPANVSSNPPAPANSSLSYASNRSLPISTSPNIKPRANHHHPPTNNEQQRPVYETTYRSSFIKPLAP